MKIDGRSGASQELRAALLGGLIIVLLAIVAERLHSGFLELDFWQLLFANVVGVLLGGYGALWANRAATAERERREEERRQASRQERALNALKVLERTVALNAETVEQVASQLTKNYDDPFLPSPTPDAFTPVLSHLAELTDELDLIAKTSRLRSTLEDINQLIRVLRRFYFSAAHQSFRSGALDPSEGQKVLEDRNQLVVNLGAQAGTALDQAREAQEAIEGARGRLRNV